MSRFHSYMNSAVLVIKSYDGSMPFSGVLKHFFAQNKKYGSRDRKEIAAICYAFFRAGRIFFRDTIEEKILKSVFLCSSVPGSLLSAIKPEWNESISFPLEEKMKMLTGKDSLHDLFPWDGELSNGIDGKAFRISVLLQPDMFVRIRPAMRDKVLARMQKTKIDHQLIGYDCLRFANGFNVESILQINMEGVIQDFSSQRTGEFLKKLTGTNLKTVWDCCAASGGKSIMAKDILGDFELTVSDVRESMIHNLRKRFSEAGIGNYKCYTADLTKPLPFHQQFDLIIADVPCTGSGTWSRTPEQLYYFDPVKIEEYSSLQQKIMNTVIKQLKPGGYLLYITCSVFKKENEFQVSYIKEELGLLEIETTVLAGYDEKADTMFASLLCKPL